MKKTLFFTSLMISSLALSQVGINTSSPASTLDVTAKNSTGTDSNIDGLLIPRVDRQSTEYERSSNLYTNLCKQYCNRGSKRYW